MAFQIFAFITACLILSWLSKSLVETLVQIAKYLKWREFVVGFFVMAFATSLPNLFVDINAALQGFPEMAFGDVVGGNLVDLTLVMALAALFSKKGIPTKSRMVQKSAIFTAVIAVLPLFLILDKEFSRLDGIILVASFFIYTVWLFSKGENFEKVYRISKKNKNTFDAFWFLRNSAKLLFLLVLLLVSSFIVVDTAQFFAKSLGVSLALVGVLIVGLGNSFPEAYFAIISAKRGEGWMILGDLMGSVIVCASLVLGLIALISPFRINDFSPFLIARAFTLLAVFLYLFAIRTEKKITKKEGLSLLSIYILFLVAEIFTK